MTNYDTTSYTMEQSHNQHDKKILILFVSGCIWLAEKSVNSTVEKCSPLVQLS